MRLLLLLVAAACSSTKPAETTTTANATQTPPPAGSEAPPRTEPSPGQSSAQPAAAGAGPSLYSCFSYVAGNSTKKRHNCMRTTDCPDMLEQAKQIKGVRELTGCASVTAVWCFHQLVPGDSEGVDVCQPTAEDCTAARTTAVNAKETVDTPCASR